MLRGFHRCIDCAEEIARRYQTECQKIQNHSIFKKDRTLGVNMMYDDVMYDIICLFLRCLL